MQKFDQYINVDAGTINPAEHGEVFVTDDGAETDLDLGHYERFLHQDLTKESSIMTGNIYQTLINRERAGEFLGETVQVIPHVTNEVKQRARDAASSDDYDIHIVEIGGTVGDDEGFHFIEAARQMRLEEGSENVLYVHVVFLPHLQSSDEVKTKPAQNSVRDLRAIGIQPDILIARTDHDVVNGVVEKLSLYTNVESAAILPLPTLDSVYEVPLVMEESGIHDVIADKLNLELAERPDTWSKLVAEIKRDKPDLTIALVGKYPTMLDTYASVIEALKAACWQSDVNLNLRWVDSEQMEEGNPSELLEGVAGIVVPGGFGKRGIEGMITAVKYARENKFPYLGLCLGMQIATIEFARNVAGIPQATSEEHAVDENDAPAQRSSAEAERSWVIHIMEDQKTIDNKGGTMRLGGWDCWLRQDSSAFKAYEKLLKGIKQSNSDDQSQSSEAIPASSAGIAKLDRDKNLIVRERHRHRYEFNNDFREQLEKAGLRVAGTTPDDKLVEIVEVKDHPWFVAVQYHAEFTSRPTTGHPLFNDFIKASKDHQE